MEVKKSLFFMAFVITLLLLFSLIFINSAISNKREDYIKTELNTVVNSFNEMQTMMLMSDIYGDKMMCIMSKSKLKDLDESLWTLGRKIDQYREITEEFFKSPFYLQQKRVFNEKEVFYLHLLKALKQKCSFNQPLILFFYKNSEECKKCDDQSFVLSDINEQIDDEISIFSFDMDLGLSTLNFLNEFYEIDSYPCVVIDDKKMCGMHDKQTIVKSLCGSNNLTICNG